MENRAGFFVEEGKRQQIATGELHLGVRTKQNPHEIRETLGWA